jgi:hypothetical protein
LEVLPAGSPRRAERNPLEDLGKPRPGAGIDALGQFHCPRAVELRVETDRSQPNAVF